jgi:hypothetical protein
LAFVGLVLWKTLGDPIFAFSAGLLADMAGFLPTVINPNIETQFLRFTRLQIELM